MGNSLSELDMLEIFRSTPPSGLRPTVCKFPKDRSLQSSIPSAVLTLYDSKDIRGDPTKRSGVPSCNEIFQVLERPCLLLFMMRVCCFVATREGKSARPGAGRTGSVTSMTD